MKKHLDLIVYISIGIIILSLWPRWAVDDAGILFRYADNFHHYGQLVWNHNQYFEGYTGLLLLLCLIASPLNYLDTAYIIGALSYLAAIAALYGMLSDRYMRGFTVLSFVCAPVILVHMFSGLETMMFVSLCLVASYGLQKKRSMLLLAALVLASLTRPEGIPFAFILLFLNKDWKAFLIWLILIGYYSGWRWWYYSSLLPNSFYRKSFSTGVLSGNLNDFLRFALTYLVIPVGMIVYSLVRGQKKHALLGSLFIVELSYYLTSNLEQNYAGRFFVHLLPIVFILLATVERIPKKIIIGLTVLQLMLFAHDLPKELQLVKEQQNSNRTMVTMATFISEKYPKTDKLAVYDAGFMPYLTGMPCLDVLGLLDSDITMYDYKHKGNLRSIYGHRIERFFNYDAEVFVAGSMDSSLVPTVFNQMLFSDPRMNRFHFVKKFGYKLESKHGQYGYYYEFVFHRTES